MIIQDLSFDKSVLICGPPDTGKASLLRSLPSFQDALFVDLEDPLLTRELLNKPGFMKEILAEVEPGEWLTVNRIDRMIKFLPLIIEAIQSKKIILAATTTSLVPWKDHLSLFQLLYCSSMSTSQTKNSLDLKQILSFGTLPKVYNLEKDVDKNRYLKNYLQDFLDMEILAKSLIRNLVPFHLFLPLAAHSSGQKINYTSIAQDLGIDYKTVQNYFDILASLHVGIFLQPYDKKVKKTQQQTPRFYFFDTGFHRAVSNTLDTPLLENSLNYNQLFKIFCINEIKKINSLNNWGCKFSFLETKDGVSVDLIIEKPNGDPDLLVFLTSTKILPKHIKHLKIIGKSIPHGRLIGVTAVSVSSEDERVSFIPYQKLGEIFREKSDQNNN